MMSTLNDLETAEALSEMGLNPPEIETFLEAQDQIDTQNEEAGDIGGVQFGYLGMSEEQVRLEALRLAIPGREGWNPAQVVEAAAHFYSFLKGE